MRLAITAGDPGNDVGIDGVALVRPVDGYPERLPALLAYHAVGIGHRPAHLFAIGWRTFAAGWALNCKQDLTRGRGLPDPDLTVITGQNSGLPPAPTSSRSAC